MVQIDLVKLQIDLESILDICQQFLKLDEYNNKENVRDMLRNIKSAYTAIVETLESLYIAAEIEEDKFPKLFDQTFKNFENKEELKDRSKIDTSCQKIKDDLDELKKATWPFLSRLQRSKIENMQNKGILWVTNDDYIAATLRQFYNEFKLGLDETKEKLNYNRIEDAQNYLIDFLSQSQVRFNKIKESYDKIDGLINK